jgi:type II secretory ATPase GspE/PulE/Tfp pilus assembly ATPase PilB-like protein
MTIVSAPPGGGLTSSWQGALTTADRLTRDCVAILETDEAETTVENIILKRYEPGPGNQMVTTKATLLSQPDFIATPSVSDAETMDLLTLQVKEFERSVLLKTTAKSAAEALLKMYAKSEDRNQFVNAIKHVTCQRLVRRLCDACKQSSRVPPKTIQQLGGDPKEHTTLYSKYQLPPPEQRVDEKGKPMEFPPCPVCGGIGYIGRVGVFEMIEVNESVGKALKTTPKLEAIELAAQKSGKKTLAQQAYKLILLGVTSIAEVQRVLKEG